jgi:hypothetical protein
LSAGRKNSDNKKDWNTPPKYIIPIKELLGEIELDPCSNEYSIVNPKTEFSLPTDGLKQNWGDYKTIFVNPPYGRDLLKKTTIKDWLEKINKTHKKYNNEILTLIPVATNTSHFKEIIFKEAKGICFLSDTRLKFFYKGKQSPKGAPMSCCMVYWGENYSKFENIFKEFGKCFKIT